MPILVTLKRRLMMASLTNCSKGLSLAVVILILSPTFLPSEQDGIPDGFSILTCFMTLLGLVSSSNNNDRALKQKKMMLGSRPPLCVNKCFHCRPCKATLVIPPHRKRSSEVSFEKDDDTYYLLTWRCRCGNRIYQP
ncbi:hypothetical protein IFM89_021394 [Coptis chinensis]|uniref:Epidermal patterning factor-like protein n=1 Tax=Coptis chinensis TaxID=261450 RepID=A0A835M5V1_9MAGN|nr:hypothetical protein IFM89_021394 [Coptis chinensis]